MIDLTVDDDEEDVKPHLESTWHAHAVSGLPSISDGSLSTISEPGMISRRESGETSRTEEELELMLKLKKAQAQAEILDLELQLLRCRQSG